MINILVISDIKIYCEGLRQILANTEAIRVIGAENNIDGAILTIEKVSPDVILLDMTMASSCIIAQKVMQFCPNTKIVALAVSDDEKNIIECAEAGITGYVARESSLDDLIEAIIGAKKGEFYCPHKIAACVFKNIKDLAQNSKNTYLSSVVDDTLKLSNELTKREWQIASLLANGLSNKQIARSLSIEVSTVKNHVHHVLMKLNAKSRTQAVSLLQRITLGKLAGSLDLEPEMGNVEVLFREKESSYRVS